MIIQNNSLANKAYVPYRANLNKLARSAARLSTGKKFASAADGTGELGVAHRMELNYRGTNALLGGLQNAQNLSQSQDEIMGHVNDIITRMAELATSAVDPTKTASDRATLENEFRALQSEVASVANTASYNGGLLFQTARTARAGIETTEVINLSAINLSLLTFVSLSVSTVATASASIISLQGRAASLIAMRAKSRGHSARLERTLQFAQDYASNLTNSASAIRDIDVAAEASKFTSDQVKVAASQAVLAQLNGITQGALQFLNL